MQTDNVDNFLDKYIDGYLLSDLASVKAKVPPIHPGSAAYLMTGAICTGIEVLGEEPVSDVNGFAFGHYCKHYMSKIDERYVIFGEIGRELIRNGIDHAFTTKPNVGITRQGSRSMSHLVRRPSDNLIIINPDFLLEDFKEAYYKYAKNRLYTGGDLHSRATLNYEKLRSRYTNESEAMLSRVASKLQSWPIQQPSSYTPSISQATTQETTVFPTIS